MMSYTEPGSASETHSGSPSRAVTAWMLPWVCAFPEYHRSMASPLTLMVSRSAPDLLPQLSSARQQRFMGTYRQAYRQDSQLGVPTEA
jgi:hypothetical protein